MKVKGYVQFNYFATTVFVCSCLKSTFTSPSSHSILGKSVACLIHDLLQLIIMVPPNYNMSGSQG